MPKQQANFLQVLIEITTPIDVPILPNTQLQGAVPAAGRNLNVAAATKMLGYPDRATDLANVAFIRTR